MKPSWFLPGAVPGVLACCGLHTEDVSVAGIFADCSTIRLGAGLTWHPMWHLSDSKRRLLTFGVTTSLSPG